MLHFFIITLCFTIFNFREIMNSKHDTTGSCTSPMLKKNYVQMLFSVHFQRAGTPLLQSLRQPETRQNTMKSSSEPGYKHPHQICFLELFKGYQLIALNLYRNKTKLQWKLLYLRIDIIHLNPHRDGGGGKGWTPISIFCLQKSKKGRSPFFRTPVYTLFPRTVWKFRTQVTQGQVTR